MPCVLAQAGKLVGREDPTKNKWLCTCKDPTLPKGKGRAWHHGRCVRERWATDETIPLQPKTGDTVQMIDLPQLGAQKGKWYIKQGAQWHAQ